MAPVVGTAIWQSGVSLSDAYRQRQAKQILLNTKDLATIFGATIFRALAMDDAH